MALTGQPVMCWVIIAGIQEEWEVKTGIDIEVVTIGDENDADFFMKNRGK